MNFGNGISVNLITLASSKFVMQNQALLICLLIASCSGDTGIQTFTKTPLDEAVYFLDQNLLGSTYCMPPCWNDITPGATYVEDAKKILEEMDESGFGEVTFNSDLFTVWHDQHAKSYLLKKVDETIVRIEIQTYDMHLGLIIDRFGSPEAIGIDYPYHGGANTLRLYYPLHGLIIYSFGLEENDPEKIIELPEDLIVYRAKFIQPSQNISSMLDIYLATFEGEEGVLLEPQVFEWE